MQAQQGRTLTLFAVAGVPNPPKSVQSRICLPLFDKEVSGGRVHRSSQVLEIADLLMGTFSDSKWCVVLSNMSQSRIPRLDFVGTVFD